jgi:hypothetical protein
MAKVDLKLRTLRCAQTTEYGHDEVFYLVSAVTWDEHGVHLGLPVSQRGPYAAQGADADPDDYGNCSAWDMNDSGDLSNRTFNAVLTSLDVLPGKLANVTLLLMESDNTSIAEDVALAVDVGARIVETAAGWGFIDLGWKVVAMGLDAATQALASIIPRNEDDHLGTVSFALAGRADGTVAVTDVRGSAFTTRILSTARVSSPFETQIRFTGDGSDYTADFAVEGAVAAPPAAVPLSLRARYYPDHYVRHRNFLGEVTTVASDLDHRDATFVRRPGLADPYAASYESTNYPGFFLRHQNFRLHLAQRDGSALFNADATFHERPGLSDTTSLSLESHNYPNYFVRHRNFDLYLDRDPLIDPQYNKDATFVQVAPLHA